MDYKTINANTAPVKPLGLIDYVNGDGLLVRDATLRVVMVRDENDLPDLAALCAPGTLALTAGGASKWQLSAAGEWQEWT